MKIHFIDKKAEVAACGKSGRDGFGHMQVIIPSHTTCEACKKTEVYQKALAHEEADTK